MIEFKALCARHIKLFFKDKGAFFTSLITPIILLVLYVTFLGNVYKNNIISAFPEGFTVSTSLIDGFVGCELFSSLLAVSCVTVAFCSNMLFVTDRISGIRADFSITPVRKSTLALSYYVATVACTAIIAYATLGIGFVYLAIVGWYLSFADVILILLDVALLVLFGTILSSVINFFLRSQGQISGVGTIVSAGYGFICGAYMPISSFGVGLQNVLMFLPGTYGTAIIRTHALRGALEALSDSGVSKEVIAHISSSVDCTLSFFGHNVPVWVMYLVFSVSILLLVGLFIFLNIKKKKAR